VKIEDIAYLDIETQHLITEFPGSWKREDNYRKIKIAEVGILQNNVYETYGEDDIDQLLDKLDDISLIVGHNITKFDYKVLNHYIDNKDMKKLVEKAFDTMLEFARHTGKGGWVSLDDLARRNFGMRKTEDSVDIPKMWREGKHEEVRNYLLNDLKMTERVYLHGRKGGKFKYEHKEWGESFGEREVFVKW
jgi:DEAD/DEAH box helicase domain-containing protein